MPDPDEKQRSSKRPLEPSETNKSREVSSKSLAKGKEAGNEGEDDTDDNVELPALATDSPDKLRQVVGIFAGLLGIIGFAVLAYWAACSISKSLSIEVLNSPNLPAVLGAKAILLLSAGGFCYALLALSERLMTPYSLLIQMVDAKGKAKAKHQDTEGVSAKAMDEAIGILGKLGKLLPGKQNE